MSGEKLSPGERAELRDLIRERVTSGEKRNIVARELAARFGITKSAIAWHIRREFLAYRSRTATSRARRKLTGGTYPRSDPADGQRSLQRQFERLIARDLEIRKAHAQNLDRIRDLSRRASRILKSNSSALKPIQARPPEIVPGLQTFGSRLRELRLSRGLTLQKVARGAGTNKGYLSWIERGRFRPPSTKFVSRIARFFSVDERELLRLAYWEKAPALIKADLARWLEGPGAR